MTQTTIIMMDSPSERRSDADVSEGSACRRWVTDLEVVLFVSLATFLGEKKVLVGFGFPLSSSMLVSVRSASREKVFSFTFTGLRWKQKNIQLLFYVKYSPVGVVMLRLSARQCWKILWRCGGRS